MIFSDAEFSEIGLNPPANKFMIRLQRNAPPLVTAQRLLKHSQKLGLLDLDNNSPREVFYKNTWISLHVLFLSENSWLFIIEDINNQKSLETELERLRETNSELNEIIELSADGLVSVDNNGHILRLNKAYKRILGIKNEQFVGKPAQELVDKGYLSQLVSPLVLKHQKPINLILTIRGKEILLTGRPVFNENGRCVRVVANIRDLTKLNRLKNELQKYHELANRYETEIHHLRAKEIESEIIGCSSGTSKMIELAAQASKVDSNVLIYGETGTGKEVLVKAIHKLSDQKAGPFIAVNCSSIPETLIESELFGHEAGSFTGSSKKGKIGLFEAANGGTLFLDEISEMSISMQTKLLRAIQEKKIRRVGANNDRLIDVRIIAASNKKLKECVDNGGFRADLYYRLNIINIDIPPLRNRKEDIPLLISHFLDKYNKKFKRQKHIGEKEMLKMIRYDWPGNIRELENMIERFVVLDNSLFLNSSIFMDDADREIKSIPPITCLKSYLKDAEYSIIHEIYRKQKSTRKTAKALNVSQSLIVRKLRERRQDN